MSVKGGRRVAIVATAVLFIGFVVASTAEAVPCPWGTNCIAVALNAPTNGSTISGTVQLDASARQTMPERGPVYKVEWWLYHPSFREQRPGNEEGKILLTEVFDPYSGTRNDGRWRGTWTVSRTVTTRDGDYNSPGLRTYNLPSDGRQYVVEAHVLDEEWTRTWGGPPGRSGPANVNINFDSNPPPLPPGDDPLGPNEVKVGSSKRVINGTNVFRQTDWLVVYTRTGSQTVSPANQWGTEAAVLDGKVIDVRNRVNGAPAMPIPVGGRVLSGHGASAVWLNTHAVIGATVVFGSDPSPPPPSPPPPSTCWNAQYFTGITLSGAPRVTRCDTAINFFWPGVASPDPSMSGSLFSARWTSTASFAAGDHRFSVTGDDGVRVKLDGTVIIDAWKDQGPTTYTTTRDVTAGSHTIVVEYYERYGDATAKFSYLRLGGSTAQGRWTVLQTSLTARSVHSTLLKDGRVLLIAGSGNSATDFAAGTFKTLVWNPANNSFIDVPTPKDLFCSGHVTLPDGKVLVAGGTASYPGVNGEVSFKGLRDAFVFDPALNRYTEVNDMIEGHWYPSLTKLESGSVWAAGGYSHRGDGGTTMVEMFDAANSRWLSQAEVHQSGQYWGTYPHMFLMSDNRLFYTGGHTFGMQRPGTGATIHDWRTGAVADIPGLRDKELRDQAGSVLLPPAQNQTFMIAGGGSTDNGGTTNKVDVVDLREASPSYRPAPDLPGPGRIYVNLTTLPDRTVLASNGGTGNRTGYVSSASIYSPAVNQWVDVPADPVGRNYHSSSLLLSDGRVVVFGSNPADNSFELRISMFEPGYLFKEGSRPVVVSAPSDLAHGQSASIEVSGSAVSASLMSPGSATHQTDTNARLVDLPVSGSGSSRTVAVPDNPALLPPGPYLLTVLDSSGVPSVAKWVNIRGTEGASAQAKAGPRLASRVKMRHLGPVRPRDVLTESALTAGCVLGYGRGQACLPTVPPSHAGHAGHDMSRAWSCAEARTIHPAGIKVNRRSDGVSSRGVDPLRLDSNKDGVACGRGDRS